MYQSSAEAPVGTVADRFETFRLTRRSVPVDDRATEPFRSDSWGSLLPRASVAVWAGFAHRTPQARCVPPPPTLPGPVSFVGVSLWSRSFTRFLTLGTPHPLT